MASKEDTESINQIEIDFKDEYKKLARDKQMFVLGFMQGVLSNQQEKSKKKMLRSD